jgi:hypothetical protein
MCTVCRHPDRVVIDRTIATGTQSLRAIASQHGLNRNAVTRHAALHLQVDQSNTPAAVAREVVQAVRREQEQANSEIAQLWRGRLESTYASVARTMERAEKSDSEKAWLSVAKFGLAAGSLIETGLRAAGVLAGGADTAVTLHIDQLVVLPSSEPRTIEVKAEIDHQE